MNSLIDPGNTWMLLAVMVVLMNMLFSLGFGKLFGYSIARNR